MVVAGNKTMSHTGEPPRFSDRFQAELEDLFRWRRDVRRFRPDPIEAGRLERLIQTASLAPSVGYSQPWRFVVVQDLALRQKVRLNFEECNQAALSSYEGEQAQRYATLKLSGLDQAPVHLAVFCDCSTATGHHLGRRTMPEMLEYSVVLACHTLWLTARACGIGVGWVSILDPQKLSLDLGIANDWKLVAYLCIGYPEEEHIDPELSRYQWEQFQPPEIIMK
jgi:5,6-dimethylbenzimidazole synthase